MTILITILTSPLWLFGFIIYSVVDLLIKNIVYLIAFLHNLIHMPEYIMTVIDSMKKEGTDANTNGE